MSFPWSIIFHRAHFLCPGTGCSDLGLGEGVCYYFVVRHAFSLSAKPIATHETVIHTWLLIGQVIAILGQDENGDTVQVEVVNQAELRGVFSDTKAIDEPLMNITEDIHIEMETPDGRVQTITVPATSISQSPVTSSPQARPRQRQHSGRGAGGVHAKRQCTGVQSVQSGAGPRSQGPGPGISPDEAGVALSFHQWLASVTERINQTMHYQFDGHPEPLVFHAPQV